MKQLTQAVFEGQPDWVKSACVRKDGFGQLWSVPSKNLEPCSDYFLSWGEPITYSEPLGYGFDATNWQNSAIDREANKCTN